MRVFHDRLSDDAGQEWVLRELRKRIDTTLDVDVAKCFPAVEAADAESLDEVSGLRGMLLCDFCQVRTNRKTLLPVVECLSWPRHFAVAAYCSALSAR